MRKSIGLIVFLLFAVHSIACTVAVVSGKATPDGRPLLWKHRDSGDLDNKLCYFSGSNYDFLALINAEDADGEMVWSGSNSVGFAIMNSASYNLKSDDDTATIKDREGIVMRMALAQCKTVADFEQLLNDLPKPMGLEANFGVIDAHGGAAFYETGNYGYVKFDANDTKLAPDGYIIRSNYSFTGTPNKGYGFVRFQTAQKLFYEAFGRAKITPEFILKKVSRSLYNSLTQSDLADEMPEMDTAEKFVVNQDRIVRYSSANSMVIQGVKQSGDLSAITLWTILGHPLSSVIVPVRFDKKAGLPSMLTAPNDQHAPLCDMSLELKKAIIHTPADREQIT